MFLLRVVGGLDEALVGDEEESEVGLVDGHGGGGDRDARYIDVDRAV